VYLSPALPWGWVNEPPSVNRLLGPHWVVRTLDRAVDTEDLWRQANEFYRRFYPVALNQQQLVDLVLGITLNTLWKESFCESSTRSTVRPAEAPGWVDARRSRRAAWLAPQSSRRRAIPGNDTLRLARTTSICQAPQYIVEALFEAEGFTDVQFVGEGAVPDRTLVSGDAQMGMLFLGPFLLRLDEGAPLLILSGGHVGCLELFAHEPIRSVLDLKGRSVAVGPLGSAWHVFLATIMAYIGLDPRKDVTIVADPPREAMRLFEEGKVDAFIASPPIPQELGAKKIGHVVVNSSVTIPGRSISTASSLGIGSSSRRTQSRRNERCAPS
jgi:ABC-type amino acid transport substrate-binding protein